MREYGALAKSLVDIPSHHIRPEKHGKTAKIFLIPFINVKTVIIVMKCLNMNMASHHICPN